MYRRLFVTKCRRFWMLNKIKQFILLLLLRKVVKDMAVIYATLIVRGYKTYKQVPDLIKEQVAEVLIELEAEHLITE